MLALRGSEQHMRISKEHRRSDGRCSEEVARGAEVMRCSGGGDYGDDAALMRRRREVCCPEVGIEARAVRDVIYPVPPSTVHPSTGDEQTSSNIIHFSFKCEGLRLQETHCCQDG